MRGPRLPPAAERRGPRTLVAVIACVLVGAAGAGALRVVGLGDGGEPRPRHDAEPAEAVLATGTAPVGGSWRITTYKSRGIRRLGGETVEPAGLTCLRLVLSDPPPGTPLSARGFCGKSAHGGFDVSNLPVVDHGTGRVEVIFWGRAPEGAAAVELADDDARIRVATREAPAAVRGDVWALAARPDMEHPRIRWLRPDGRAAGARDVSLALDTAKRLAAGSSAPE